MSIISQRALCAVIAAGATSFGFAAAQAQPAGDYPTVGGLVVTAPYHHERGFDGAPIQNVRVSRVVQVGDLDLSSPWGRRELRARVWRAAAADCNDLDNMWTQGMFPVDGSQDCLRPTVRRAMYEVYGGGSYGAPYGNPYAQGYGGSYGAGY